MHWAVDGETEEDLVVNVDVLAKGLIGVQWRNFTFDKGSCTSSGCLKEIIVDFGYGTVLLHSLDEVLSGEVLNNLEFFIPVVHLFGIDTIQRN
jgi:hypothetical protein